MEMHAKQSQFDFSFVIAAVLIWSVFVATSVCQVTHDGSLGPAVGLTGPNFQIDQANGTTIGDNLFHSFSQFGLSAGEAAEFNGNANIQNILTRVTGASASSIDGTIRSNVQDANLFLMNPKGILFGPNASLDVSGAFTATTADQVLLSDGAVFAVSGSGDATLTTADVSAFGFTDPLFSPVELSGAVLKSVSDGAPISLVGEGLELKANSRIETEGGNIYLISVASSGTVVLDVSDPNSAVDTSSFSAFAPVLVDESSVDSSDRVTPFLGGGRILVHGDDLRLEGGELRSDTAGASAGRGIDVLVRDSISMGVGTGSSDALIGSSSTGLGDAGSISLRALESITLTDVSQILSTSEDAGSSGDITLDAGESVTVTGASLISTSSTGAGNAGDVTIRVGDAAAVSSFADLQVELSLLHANISNLVIELTSPEETTISLMDSVGGAGTSIQHVLFDDGAPYGVDEASSFSAIRLEPMGSLGALAGESVSGNWRLSVHDQAAGDEGELQGWALRFGEEVYRSSGAGLAIQDLQTTMSDVQVSSPGQNIEFGLGNGGIMVSGTASIQSGNLGTGQGGSIYLDAPTVFLDGRETGDLTRGISTASGSSAGQAGDVEILASSLDITEFWVSADTSGSGSAGSVLVQVDQAFMSGGRLSAAATSGASGDAGDVFIEADWLSVTNSAEISTSAFSPSSNAGAIDIEAEELYIVGEKPAEPTGLYTGISGSGTGGEIRVSTELLHIADHGQISTFASAGSSGSSGMINIDAGELTIQGESGGRPTGIFAINRGAGLPGIISLDANTIDIRDQGRVATDTYGTGDGNSLEVTAGSLVISKSGRITSVARDGSEGDAGQIVIDADFINLEEFGFISSGTEVSADGDAGGIFLNGSEIVVDGKSGNGATGIYANTAGRGRGGDINIETLVLRVVEYGQIASGVSPGGEGDGGRIVVEANEVLLRGDSGPRPTGFFANTSGLGDAGGIQVDTGTLEIYEYGQISSGSFRASGDGGGIVVNAGRITIEGPGPEGIPFIILDDSLLEGDYLPPEFISNVVRTGGLFAETTGDGNGGDITIETGQLLMTQVGMISTQSDGIGFVGDGSGEAGNILIKGDDIQILERAFLSSRTGGEGKAGEIRIEGGKVSIDSFGYIDSSTTGPGKGGNIEIDGVELRVGERGLIAAAAGVGGGDGGNISLQANNLEVAGLVSTAAYSFAQAGDILVRGESMSVPGTVSAAGFLFGSPGKISFRGKSLDIQGAVSTGDFGSGASRAGTITVAVYELTLRSGSIGSDTVNFGGGAIKIDVATLYARDGASISADSSDFGFGGGITVTADKIELRNSSISTDGEFGGDGGSISITAGTLDLLEGSFISSNADDGSAGTVSITITEGNTLRLLGGSTIASSNLDGFAGSVLIDSIGLILLEGNSSISVESLFSNAGSIEIRSGTDVILNDSSITARAGGNSGNIVISADGFIWLTNSSISAEADENGGNVILRDARFTLVNNSTITADAFFGDGGFIQVSTDVFFRNNSRISASSEFGVNGEVRVDGISDLSGTQAGLDAGLLDASNQLQDRCTVRIPGERGSFVLVGRGGVPVMPGRFLPAQQLLKLEDD